MFEISQEDRDVMNMCHENRRRSEITTTIGYFVPQQEAMEYAAIKAAQKRRGGDWQNVGFMILATMAVIVATVASLGG